MRVETVLWISLSLIPLMWSLYALIVGMSAALGNVPVSRGQRTKRKEKKKQGIFARILSVLVGLSGSRKSIENSIRKIKFVINLICCF